MSRPAARRPRNRAREAQRRLAALLPCRFSLKTLAPGLLAGATAWGGALAPAAAATIEEADGPQRSLAAAFERAAATPELFDDPGALDGAGAWVTVRAPRTAVEQSVLAEELAWWSEETADAPAPGSQRGTLAWWRGAPAPLKSTAADADAPADGAALAWWSAGPTGPAGPTEMLAATPPATPPVAPTAAPAPLVDAAVTPASTLHTAVGAAALAWWSEAEPIRSDAQAPPESEAAPAKPAPEPVPTLTALAPADLVAVAPAREFASAEEFAFEDSFTDLGEPAAGAVAAAGFVPHLALQETPYADREPYEGDGLNDPDVAAKAAVFADDASVCDRLECLFPPLREIDAGLNSPTAVLAKTVRPVPNRTGTCERLVPTEYRTVERPEDAVGPCFAAAGDVDATPYAARARVLAMPFCFSHRPLYFEDPNLERCGVSCGPCVQPLVSGAHFFGTVPLLPWWAATQPFCVPVRATPYCPPCRQYDFADNYLPPLEAEGAIVEGAALAAFFLLLP